MPNWCNVFGSVLFCVMFTLNIGKKMSNIDEESVLRVVLFKFLLCSLKETTIPKIYEVRHTLSFLSVAFYFFEHVTSENTKATFINAFSIVHFLYYIHAYKVLFGLLVLLNFKSCKLFNVCNISHQASCTYAEFSVCPMSSIS